MTNKLRKVIAVSLGVGVAICLVLLSTLILEARWGEDTGAAPGIAERLRGAIQLVRPVFAYEAGSGANFLQEEAGISAFVNVGREIDLDWARKAFVGMSGQGESFIIGKVALEGLPEEAFPLVYVHRDGWILAYYTKLAPASRIMPWHGGEITTTTLEAAIAAVCREIGIDFSAIQGGINFYDFRFPTATTLILVADWLVVDSIVWERTDTFNYQIPFNVTLYEASWAHTAIHEERGWVTSIAQVNDTHLSTFDRTRVPQIRYGRFDHRNLIADKLHSVTVQLRGDRRRGWSGIAVVFIYSGD